MRAWAAVVVVLVLAGCNDERRAGTATSSYVITQGDGGALLLIDRIKWSNRQTRNRMVSIDLLTGKETGLRLVGSSDFTCIPSLEGRMWCSPDLALHDVRKLSTIATTKSLLAKQNMTAKGNSYVSAEAAYLEIVGGETVRVDPTTLDVTVVSGLHDYPRDDPAGGHTCHINEIWLADARTGEPIEIAGDRLLLDEDREGKWRVVRGGLGESVWAVPLLGECETATRAGDLLIIATKSSKQRALAIDLVTGKPQWTYGF
jgi:hypothetical protein